MSLAIIHSRAQVGIEAPPVQVEVHLSNGLPSFTMVGLPETAVRESKDRVRSALLSCGLNFPQKRITLSLAPADLPKDGARFDLAIALGLLAASGQIPASALQGHECIGELGLSGEIRPVRGVLPAALACRKAGQRLIIPADNAEEASLVSGLEILASGHLAQLLEHFNGQQQIGLFHSKGLNMQQLPYPDLQEVQGQESATRA